MNNRERFDAVRMIADAERDTGLSDWGGEAYFEPLFRQLFSAMVTSINDEAGLNERGHHGAALRLPDILRSRLQLIDDRKKWPDITRERIDQPLVITGLPRAGTTFLQSLLAQDPDNRVTRIWEMMYPSPPPQAQGYDNDPRIARAQSVLDALGITAAQIYDLHPTSARLPEECHYIEELLALGDNLRTLWHMPSYNRLRAAVDETIPYHFDRLVLQNLQYRNPGKRWVLKGPAYVLHLAEIIAVHPDARIVQMHRDPARIIPSIAGLVLAMRRAGSDADLPAPRIAMGNLKAFARGVSSAREFRQQDPEQNRYLDIHFKALIADPIATARRVYSHFGLDLGETALTAMRTWLNTPESKGASVRHRLGDYQLDEAIIEDYFGEYIDYYGIERERGSL